MSEARAIVTVAVAVMAAGLMAQAGEPRAEVVIRDIAVVDVIAGRVLPARDIVVRGTRIERVAPSGGPLPPGKTVIDGRGKFAMPGLIDAPVRLAVVGRGRMQELLAAGVTAVGDAGSEPAMIGQWRRDVNEGRLWAPRIVDGCGPAPIPAPSATPRAPHAVHDALVTMVGSGGRTPAQALRAVTIDRARAWCLDGLGTLAAGSAADVVVLTSNPLEDIRATRDIDAVVFRGGVLTYAHLQMLRRHALPAPTPPD